MKQKLKAAARRGANRLAPGLVGSVQEARGRLDAQERQLNRLRGRVVALEAEVMECRAQNRRIAELTDIVQELVVPAARRDEARLDEALRQYADRL